MYILDNMEKCGDSMPTLREVPYASFLSLNLNLSPEFLATLISTVVSLSSVVYCIANNGSC